jgi:hypothetical protein
MSSLTRRIKAPAAARARTDRRVGSIPATGKRPAKRSTAAKAVTAEVAEKQRRARTGEAARATGRALKNGQPLHVAMRAGSPKRTARTKGARGKT